jgi:hypothetical protein
MQVMAYPFRLTLSGSVQSVTQGSDAHKAQQIAGLVQTRKGELPLALTYGIVDPVFSSVSDTEIAAALLTFLPEIEVISVSGYMTPQGQSVVDIKFKETDDAVA